MHIEGVGCHFLRKQFGCYIGEAFLVMLVGKEEKGHACEKQQKDSAKEQLPGGESGLLFQSITLRYEILLQYMKGMCRSCMHFFETIVFGDK